MACSAAPQAWSTGAATTQPRGVARGAARVRSVERSNTRRGSTVHGGQLLVGGGGAGAAHLIEAFLKDVAAYLINDVVQARVNNIVADEIGEEPFVAVAHSLGTVVTYNVLRSAANALDCRALITLGSPLGIRGVAARLKPPLTWPTGVSRWFNGFDPSDVVALHPLDREHFDLTPEIENYGKVKNFTDNRHGISGYLSDPVVAGWIAAAAS